MSATEVDAQTAATKLGDCLVASTTGADRVALARWIGFAIAAHPSIKDSIAVPATSLNESDRDIASLVTQLMTVNCVNEARDAMNDGENGVAIEQAFEVLGQVAMSEIMMNEDVNFRIAGFVKYLDESALSEALE